MGVRFCLICVKIVTHLPFLWHPLPLRAWAVISSIGRGWTPKPCAKLQWWFWCQCWGEHWALTCPCAGGWTRCATAVALASPVYWKLPNNPSNLVHGAQAGGSCATATPESLVFTAHIRLTKLPVNAAPGEAGQTDSSGETGISLGLWSSTALLQELTQWRHCAATALASITKPGGNDRSEGATVRRNYVFALLSRLNLIFHAPKGTSRCSETFVAQSWRKLSSATRFVFSKNTIFFRTS